MGILKNIQISILGWPGGRGAFNSRGRGSALASSTAGLNQP